MKIAILNDTHCGARNSSEIFMDYQELFYRDVFFPYLLEHDIKKIIHLGDYYENRNSMNIKCIKHNRKIFLEKLKEYGIHMDIIPGNHDVYYKNTNEISTLNEVLGFFTDEVNIVHEPTVIDYDGLKVGLIPWINSENEAEIISFLNSCDAPIVGAHLELAGFEIHQGFESLHGMEQTPFRKFEMVLTGHFHTKSQKNNIHYLGSQMEFTWSDCEDRKYFHILDTDTKQLTPVQNPNQMFVKLYYDDVENNPETKTLPPLDNKYVKVVVVNKSKPRKFESYIDRIQRNKLHGLSILENFSDFIGTNVEDDKVSVEDTESLLYTYIDATDTDLDKDRIKSQMHQLMVEAETLEIE